MEELRRELDRLQLAASRDRSVLDTIVRDSPHGIVMCDEHGTLTLENPAARRIWAGPEPIAPTARSAGAGDGDGADRAASSEASEGLGHCATDLAAVLRDRNPIAAVERHIVRADGTDGWLLSSSTPLVDLEGRLLGAISIFADITAQKTAQARLQRHADERALMARAADLFASTLEVEVVLAELARIVVPRLGDWCAIDLVEAGAVRRVIVHHRDPAMVELARQLETRYPTSPDAPTGMHAVIRTGKTQYRGELTDAMMITGARDPDHLALLRRLALRSFAIAPIACRGEVFGAITVVTSESGHLLGADDVRVIEELATRCALSVANARLYVEAQAKAAALELERKALATSNAELDEFAYAASHDLRAPLRGIANLATWIEEDLGTAMPATVASNLALLRGRVARMDNLINAILALSRVGRVKARPETIELGELVREVSDLLAVAAPARVVVRGMLPTIVAERAGLQQVLLNVISNALKHAERADVEVTVSCVVRDTEVELAIADNGAGIPREHHARVWNIFQTLRPRDVAENTGIGLALVRKHVEAAGGRAWIDPDVATGATFRFTWPTHAPAAT